VHGIRENIELALEKWLSTRVSGASEVEILLLDRDQATGYSHTTLIFDASWNDKTERFVARAEPLQTRLFPDPDVAREVRVQNAVEGVPLPRIIGLEEDASILGSRFYVMEHVVGEIPGDLPRYTAGGWLADASPEGQERAWWSGFSEMIRVHETDWRARDFGFLARVPGIGGQLEYWQRYGEWAAPKGLPATAERSWELLIKNKPDDCPLSLCWGDSRLGNQIFRDFRCVAVLDWEMATIADAEQDLAWWLYFDDLYSQEEGHTRPAGFPSGEESAAVWEEAMGRPVKHSDYYQLFAAFRFAMILYRLGSLMVEAGQLPADSTFPHDNFASQYLARLLDTFR
jgi:aminoglycoside phosphotransferase (APT) family kinase protein